MNIIYREALASDAELLLEHIHTVSAETDNLSFSKDDFNISPEKEARFIERFKKSEKDLMIIAIDGNKVVANGIIEREKIKRYSHRAELSITVLKDYWGQGIGSRLMELMIDFCKNTEVHSLSLVLREDNLRASALYRKFAFESVGVYKDYFQINGEYFNAEFMRLEI